MNNTNNNTANYTFEGLLKDNRIHKIEIPRIQRDYAQGRADEKAKRIRKNFVSALYTAITNEKTLNLDFVYGNIDKDGILTLLDGQQRLTTLFLLHWYTAKKTERVDIELLKKFKYEIRPSTRDFCAKLLEFNPFLSPEKDLSEEGNKISYEITNQHWFLSSWNKDPSIVSMLIMLDEIHHQFKNSSVTWEDLAKITFYFLPLEDMGLTDDLYIKMNSRGKPLTDFEHFKAELDKKLARIDNANELASRIRSKFDVAWTDLLWNYRGSGTNTENDNIVDDEFLRYIHFICDVIYYKNETDDKENKINHNQWNEFDLLKLFFTVQENNDEQKVKENFETLEKYFDCWCEDNLKKIDDTFITPSNFLSSFINEKEEYQQNKIITQIGNNIFKQCLAKYTTHEFLKQFVFLYAVTYYLQHTEIGYDNFVRRIRIINNLIQNSDTEITQNRMNNILKHVEEILDTGEIEEKQNTFNKYQLAEEKHKLALLKIHPKFIDDLFKLEDHELLYGQIGILFDFTAEITQEDIDTAANFVSLFNNLDENTSAIIDCALMSIGDYSQVINNTEWRWRHTHQFGTIHLSIWQSLFHQKEDTYFTKTKDIVLKLLKKIKNKNGTNETTTILKDIKNNFIAKCESEKKFSFKYYYIQYNNKFNPKYGNGKTYSYFGDEYTCTVLSGEKRNKNTYNPYLEAAYHAVTDNTINNKIIKKLDNVHEYFEFKTCTLQQEYTDKPKAHYVYRIYNPHTDIDTDKIVMEITIKQNEEIDTENRIDKLKKYITLILKYEKEREDAATLKEYLEKNYQEEI